MFGFSKQKRAESPRHTEANYHMAEGISKCRAFDRAGGLREFEAAQGMFDEANDLPGIAAALMSKAQTHQEVGNANALHAVFGEAQETARRAENLANKDPAKAETYRVLGECADLCDLSDRDGDCQRLAFSEDCYKKATQLHKLCGDSRNEAAAWNNLGGVHHQRFLKFIARQPCGDELGYEQARRAYERAFEINQRAGNLEASLRNQRNMERLDGERRRHFS